MVMRKTSGLDSGFVDAADSKIADVANLMMLHRKMNLKNTPLVVYVDVDDTLVRSVGAKRIPIKCVIDHVQQLYREGAKLYCWSSAGADYARTAAEELEIAGCFLDFLPKPNILIDDQRLDEWRLCREIHPMGVSSKRADDYWEEILAGK